METIRFYSEQGEYGAFLNFALYPIALKGRWWVAGSAFAGGPSALRSR